MTTSELETDVSVIIVNWNTRDILLECIESLEGCGTKCRTEIIVVDNGSEDGSAGAVRERFPGVKLIENRDNLGFAKAYNIGMNQASGRHICLMNSDVKVREGCIDNMIHYMRANPSVGMLGPKVLNPDYTLQDSCRRFPSLWTNLILALGFVKLFPKSKLFYGEHMFFFNHDETRDVDYIAGCFMLVRRDAIDQIGMLDERFFIYCEEVDWCKRFHQGNWRITFFPGGEVIHHHGASSSLDPIRFSLEQQRSTLKYWCKHHRRYERFVLFFELLLKYILKVFFEIIIYVFRKSRREEAYNNIIRNLTLLKTIFYNRTILYS